MSRPNRLNLTRRQALSVGIQGATLLAGCASGMSISTPPTVPTTSTPPSKPEGEPPMNSVPVLQGNHSVLPLPFAAGSLSGLSERLIASHHDNNYAGAVRNLNRVEQELAQITPDTPPFMVAALRERELAFRNSKALHEAYFANLGGNGKRSGPIEGAIAKAYGSTARWEQHMQATALGLGGGSGWALLVFELDTGDLRTVSSAGHPQMLGTSLPLLVLDMYEHSYHMDFGTAAAHYLEAFFANTHWDEVNRRLEKALSMSALLRQS